MISQGPHTSAAVNPDRKVPQLMGGPRKRGKRRKTAAQLVLASAPKGAK